MSGGAGGRCGDGVGRCRGAGGRVVHGRRRQAGERVQAPPAVWRPHLCRATPHQPAPQLLGPGRPRGLVPAAAGAAAQGHALQAHRRHGHLHPGARASMLSFVLSKRCGAGGGRAAGQTALCGSPHRQGQALRPPSQGAPGAEGRPTLDAGCDPAAAPLLNFCVQLDLEDSVIDEFFSQGGV